MWNFGEVENLEQSFNLGKYSQSIKWPQGSDQMKGVAVRLLAWTSEGFRVARAS